MNQKEYVFLERNNEYVENEYFVGQKESRFHSNDQQINIQVESQLSTLSYIFDWITNDQLQELRSQILHQIKLLDQNVKTKYITTALSYILIKNTSGINETECIQQLLNKFNVKSRKLLKYLRMIKDDGQRDMNKLLQQIQYYQEKVRKYFFGQGQSLLLKLKKPNQTYTQLIEEILETNKQVMIRIFSLQLVKQFCVSKRPSRLVINLGYFAFQIQSIYILPGEYARIFRISINSLRHFSKGLINILYQFVLRITGQGIETQFKSCERSPQISQTIMNEGELKKSPEDTSVSEPNIEIEGFKLLIIRKLINEFSIYQFLFVDTEEEDELFNECQEILNFSINDKV
ncbi:unnamed protein product [Paramecium pentaurelia]|uniref:Uncharacterized protein n=1 Tax=Paramecium pentaurelia TaxID=43138 RepID=A0A8S1VTF3_9CILI|nr:unnamed protein product [Paramecium pentaurelia]